MASGLDSSSVRLLISQRWLWWVFRRSRLRDEKVGVDGKVVKQVLKEAVEGAGEAGRGMALGGARVAAILVVN